MKHRPPLEGRASWGVHSTDYEWLLEGRHRGWWQASLSNTANFSVLAECDTGIYRQLLSSTGNGRQQLFIDMGAYA